ncbi:hypothetical protein HME9304_02782 [Flagellimonas maritima]|uniref:Uncharacterized protein n=1 Tax=Flagellimonas maritima TaxID=1383885 RepID=A0A2Z4LVI7_9FLAO|nr:hypothetical protein HME9304_02782 [Allomuricauda aurantiaca]
MIGQLKYLKDDNFIPLNQIENRNEIGETYRYVLAPLMLKCLEDKFVRSKMILVIQYLLEFAKNETLSLQLWKNSAIKSGIKKEAFEEFEKHFITNKEFKQNIINEILKNYS